MKAAVLLLGLDSQGQLAIAKFGSSYASSTVLAYGISKYVLGAGKTSDGSTQLLKLGSTGEWLT